VHTTFPDASALRDRYLLHRRKHPRQYLRDAAADLGVSELELLLASTPGAHTLLRTDDLAGLLGALGSLGPVKTMTRNDSVVLERVGAFASPTFFGSVGQVLGDIDLRIFSGHWCHAVATHPSEGRASIQWFDGAGVAVHKVHLEPSPPFAVLMAAWRAEVTDVSVTPAAAETPARTAPSDVMAFRAEWDVLTDTHEFHGLLRRHGLSRIAALEAADAPRARRVPPAALALLLEGARDRSLPIMAFVGNRGVIQIHSGVPVRVARTPGWLNILDPEVNLHVREDDIAEAWVVRKPASGGVIASLECFDRHGRDVLLVFGKRHDDAPASVTEPFAALLEALPSWSA
jgi:putative hemin transport protein